MTDAGQLSSDSDDNDDAVGTGTADPELTVDEEYRRGCIILTDLRQYGFPEFWYYTDTDSTLEHNEQWWQLRLSRWGSLDMTDEPQGGNMN